LKAASLPRKDPRLTSKPNVDQHQFEPDIQVEQVGGQKHRRDRSQQAEHQRCCGGVLGGVFRTILAERIKQHHQPEQGADQDQGRTQCVGDQFDAVRLWPVAQHQRKPAAFG